MSIPPLFDGTKPGRAEGQPRSAGRFAKLACFASAATAFWLSVPSRLALADSPGAPNGVVLSVSVGNTKGRVRCGIYERNGWLKRPIKDFTASIHANVATCHFEGIKPGTYAVGAFHDENANGRLDRSWTGLPREPWCLSRGPRGTFGPPPFDAASFSVTNGTVHLSCRAR